MNECNICLNFGRPIKYKTSRVSICQWCVTNIIKNYDYPSKYECDFEKSEILFNYEYQLTDGEFSKDFEPSSPYKRTKEEVYSEAESIVKRNEALLTTLFRNYFNNDKRNKEIILIFKDLTERYQEQYDEELENYRNNLRQYKKNREDYISHKTDIINEKYKDWLSDIVSYDDSSSIRNKLIRAYYYGLVDGERNRVSRLHSDEMEPIRETILKEDNFTCVICKDDKQPELHVHHIIPLEYYGTHNLSNLVTLCYSCHNKQHEGMVVTRNKTLKRQKTGGDFVAISIKTSGYSKNDKIIEIGAIKFIKGKPYSKFWSLIDTELTPLKKTPSIEVVIPRLSKFVGNYKLALHNSSFILRFLNSHLMNITNEKIDILPLSKEKIPYLHNHKLKTLAQLYNLPFDGEHDRSDEVALVIGKVYIKCQRITKQMIKDKKFIKVL